MGTILLKDEEVYKYVDSWTALNMNDAVKKKCDAVGTGPSSFAMFGVRTRGGTVVRGNQSYVIDGKPLSPFIPGYNEGDDE